MMSKAEPSFEDAMKRLEAIVQSIEQGKIGLEESIRQYEEGMALIKRCRTVLSEAEIKIQHLQASGSDGVQQAPPAAH
ncbi:MAG: exodeoxyribonuclease VII small subunit [Planctomycetota bacterium]|nr:MAG: exodeoxyribonuclease VII small subunit [Planctomycetota bacterium]